MALQVQYDVHKYILENNIHRVQQHASDREGKRGGERGRRDRERESVREREG